LLGVVAGTDVSATVGIPPNAETVIVNGTFVQEVTVSVVGVTTGAYYAGTKAYASAPGSASNTWFFDVSSALDTEVVVTLSETPVQPWYVYADAGTHLVADVSKVVDVVGRQLVVPQVPYTGLNGGPVVEVLVKSALLAANGAMLATPGLLRRYRLFSVQMASTTAASVSFMQDSIAGTTYCALASPGNATTNIPAQGVPLGANAALDFTISAGAPTVAIVVMYTIETV
jgi:hypothetical protein